MQRENHFPPRRVFSSFGYENLEACILKVGYPSRTVGVSRRGELGEEDSKRLFYFWWKRLISSQSHQTRRGMSRLSLSSRRWRWAVHGPYTLARKWKGQILFLAPHQLQRPTGRPCSLPGRQFLLFEKSEWKPDELNSCASETLMCTWGAH